MYFCICSITSILVSGSLVMRKSNFSRKSNIRVQLLPGHYMYNAVLFERASFRWSQNFVIRRDDVYLKRCIRNRILEVHVGSQSEELSAIFSLYKCKQADLSQSMEIQLGITCKHCCRQECQQ